MSDEQGRYQKHIDIVLEVVLEAGALLRAELHREGGPRGSGSKSPADDEAEALLRDCLEAAFPLYGVRGEELGDRDREPEDADSHRWLIDPNDGTQSFIRGQRGASVSVGLTRAGVPVLGVVYAYAAPDDDGDLFWWAEGCGPLRHNGAQVSARSWPSALSSAVTVIVSQSADSKSSINSALVAPARFRAEVSLAYRLALVAVGEGDVAVSLNGPTDWDCAAGHALLRGVGGELYDERGEVVRYEPWGRGMHFFGGGRELTKVLAWRSWERVFGGRSERLAAFGLCLPQPGRSARDAEQLRRAQGCLLGQFSGDALGSLVEFRSPDDILDQYPNGVRSIVDGGTWNTIAGQPTDDSELALALARSIVDAGGFDLEAVARRYAHWYRSEPFDIGNTTAKALSAAAWAAEEGFRVSAAAQGAAKTSSQANGALMRVAPLGVYGASLPPDVLAGYARADASLSHPHPICQDASAIFAVVIAFAIREGASPRQMYDYALESAREFGSHPESVECLESAEREVFGDYMRHQGWVKIAFQNAFYQLLHAPTLEAGVIDTVNRGGDTDTNGAIAGALLGAAHGQRAIPTQWRRGVLSCRPLRGLSDVRRPRPREFWPVDALLLAERLLLV